MASNRVAGDPASSDPTESDWEQFTDQVSWFVSPRDSVEVGEPRPWSRGQIAGLPLLSELVEAATVTPVSVKDREYELLAWGPIDDRRGWLSRPPAPSPVEGIAPSHQRFLAVCGGMVEWFGDPESWWTNQDEVLTVSAARLTVGPALLSDYYQVWVDAATELRAAGSDLDTPEDYCVVALEANGNTTMSHRRTGRIVLFAPDHGFDAVTPLPGCPPYSLMTLDEAPDLDAWIESCAQAWLAAP